MALHRGAVPHLGARYVVELLGSPDPAALLASAIMAAGAVGGTLYVLQEDGWLRLAAAQNMDGPPPPYKRVSLSTDLPITQAVRERRATRTATLISLPLLLDGNCLGCVNFFRARAERPTLDAVAALCTYRMDRLLPPSGDRAQAIVAQGLSRSVRLELAMSSAEIGSFDWDFTTGGLVWDERLCHLFGVDPETFDGRIETFYDAVHPDDRASVEEAVRRSRKTGKYRTGYRIRRPDGEIRWIDAEARVFLDANEEPQGMIGVAQDHTEQHRLAQRRRARKDLVLRVSHGLAAALTTRDVVETIGETVLTALGAHGVAIFISDGTSMRLLGARGYDAEGTRRLEEMGTAIMHTASLAPVGKGDPLFIESREDYLAVLPEPALAPLPGQHAWALLPLSTPDRTFGVCVISFGTPYRFAADDRTTLLGIAALLAQSLARARLYDEHRSLMTELQRLMLPGHLPDLPGLQIMARYLPGQEKLEVGGDWYDVLTLPDDRVALVIGDVQGHSAQAAAVMGQLRTAMSVYAHEGYGPADLMSRANLTLANLDTDRIATCCIVELGPGRDTMRIARAGHPFPLLRTADGNVHELESPVGMPLGCFPDETYPVMEQPLSPGATLLLYTDGLVEYGELDYSEGVAELSRGLAAGGPLDELADRIVTPEVRRAQHDDIAMLLLCRE